MRLRVITGIVFTLFLIGMLTLAFNIQPVKASSVNYRSFGSSEPLATEWNKTYGGTDDDWAYSVQQTSDGEYITAGYTASFGAGGLDFWLVKTYANGSMEWSKTYGGAGGESACSSVQTSDGGYIIAGYTTSFGAGARDFWLVKVSSTPVEPSPPPIVYIKADGSVEGTDKIQRDGDVYTFTDNIINKSIVVERDNIVLDGAGYTLQGTGDGHGIDLLGRSNITIKNMEIRAFFLGIWLVHSSNNSITGNNMTNNDMAIDIGYSSNNIISGNSIRYVEVWYGWLGIDLAFSSNNSIIGNNVTNYDLGIHLWSSSNNALVSNNFSSNHHAGIWILNFSDNNIVSCNTASNNEYYGIYLLNSSNNALTGNNVSNNHFGIYLGDSNNNVIFHNNFINNTDQVYVEPDSVNIWDDGYPSGGNYWSDYTGEDADGDGMGDTPYVIDENNQDNYPLMNPWIPVEEVPPFWMQWWFWSIVAVVIVALAGAVYLLKKRKPPTPTTPTLPKEGTRHSHPQT